MTLDDILNEIQIAEKIVILSHEAPDGDAVGSSLAMMHALKQLGKKSDVIIPEYSRLFSFLPGASDIITESKIKEYDLAIALDCADIKRLKCGEEYFETAKRKIQIDHHGSNTMFGDLNFVNPASPACCEILVEMLNYYNITIDKNMGACLVAGIITDTGGFRYPKTSAETFEFTAELLRKGVNVSEIYKRVQDTKTKANFELTKLVIDRIELLENGRVSFTYIMQNDIKEIGAEVGDHEGLVEIGRDIEGVEVSIFIREKEDGTFKASLRSNSYVNVADICLLFNGGGHQMAAGCSFKEDRDTAKTKLLNEIKKVLK